jgi:hypothetical protein
MNLLETTQQIIAERCLQRAFRHLYIRRAEEPLGYRQDTGDAMAIHISDPFSARKINNVI